MKAGQTRYKPLLAAAALLTVGAAAVSTSTSAVAAAEKSRRGKTESSSNNSIRTQELTADAFAERNRTTRPSSRPSDTPDDWRTQLSDVEDRIRAEEERHDAAMADLKKTARGSKGKKALDKEQATHEQRFAELDEQRQSLLVKLNGDGRQSPAGASTQPSKTAAKKPAKTSNTRKR